MAGKIEAEKLTAGKANILFWLEEGKEPTEHILNELIEHHVRYSFGCTACLYHPQR